MVAESPCKKSRASAALQPWVPEDLAETLRTKSGIPNIERLLFDAEQIAFETDIAQKAADVLQREGIVLIRGALDAETIEAFKSLFPKLIAQIREFDPDDQGSRGEKRHSFGGMSSTNSQLHHPEFRALLDVPSVTNVLEAYWQSKDFACLAGGGDLNMAGSRQHQILHNDIGWNKLFGPSTALGSGEKAPMIAVNYLIEDQTPFNGPLQHIPGTQRLDEHYIPDVPHEPEHWFFSTICPAPAGTAVIRDVRTWHAGTPNITTRDRPLPNCEFLAPFAIESDAVRKGHKMFRAENAQISHDDWEALPERAQHLARFIKAAAGQKVEPSTVYKVISSAGTCAVSPLFQGCVSKPPAA